MSNAVTATPATLVLGTDNFDGTVTGVTTGTSKFYPRAGYGTISFFLRSIGTTTGGTILIEEADWLPSEHPYTGTWVTLTSISANSFTGGAMTSYHPVNAGYGYVRARISSDITGGGTILITTRAQGSGS